MVKFDIEIDEETLKRLVLNYLMENTGNDDLKIEDVKILVRSKQNFKSEWEVAHFKASLNKFMDL